MNNPIESTPDSSAVRVALWRALHLEVDGQPPILNDSIGLDLVKPDSNWRQRPDMHPLGTRGYRAGIVARARYLEDLVGEQLKQGIKQYVILGAGLDTFVQRKPELASQLNVFEIDQPSTQNWKQQRLIELGFGIPNYLHFVPVNFEAGESWLQKLIAHGFDPEQPAVIASTGVSMYLTKEANLQTLQQVATFTPGSILALTFILTMDLIPEGERQALQNVYDKARAAGTPFLSFFTPDEIVKMANFAGFKKSHHLSRENIIQRYFANRDDGLLPSYGEEFLIAST